MGLTTNLETPLMKNPSIPFILLFNNFRVLWFVVFWVAASSISVSSQEIGRTNDSERIESEQSFFKYKNTIDYESDPFAKGVKIQNALKGFRFSPPEIGLEHPESFVERRPLPSFRFSLQKWSSIELPVIEPYEAQILLKDLSARKEPIRIGRFGSATGEINRRFDRFFPTPDFPIVDEKTESDLATDDPPAKVPPEEKFHWRPAINQSLMMLGIQHGYALVAQEKTRQALANGNFFTDYWRSVRGLRGWDDGNRFFTNYIAHPMQGGLTGFIFIQNHDRAKKQKFAESKQYWKDRFKALIWSTAWSTQFELGPISQSSIGNVGHYGGLAYVDLVVTPTVGTAWMMSEEAIDRYIIRHIETHSLPFRAILRMFLNPMRTVANMLRFREPWYRDRPLLR